MTDSVEQFEEEMLKRPGIRKEYEALQPKYDKLKERITTQLWHEYGIEVGLILKANMSEIIGKQDLATGKALKFKIDDNDYWFPKSEIGTVVDPDGVCHYYAPNWMMRQKRLL